MPSDTPQTAPTCPVGENQCNIIDELINSRETIEALNEQLQTDSLTQLGNYRQFCQIIDKEMERTQRTGQPTAMILVDLDFFKKVNDNWGHEVGNLALVQTAKLLKTAIRKLDIPCRYGGEEFIVILPSTDLLTGTQVAERLRALIADTPLEFETEAGAQSIQLTASMGIDIYTHTHHETREEFVARVDSLLYEAKHGGRNQVKAGVRQDMQPTANVSADEKDALFGIFGDEE
ncbi:GGDEF domain-containing protein [Candidatus Pelagadaptatus aseana]|uniref:GGDEF domain-containing protein n=1 Tax=Candidatus Pelagadaptatus aseana TaxID=3120508 RepID=UPI003C6FACC0